MEKLEQTNRIIDRALAEAGEEVLRLDQEYRDAKRYMVDSYTEMDSHEKLQTERLFKQTDRTGVFAVEGRERLKKLRESPYFARIDFACEGEDGAEPYYIGRFGCIVPAAWIHERWKAYDKAPVKKRLISVAEDIRENLHSLPGMREEVPKPPVIAKSLNKMLRITDSFALYQDFYQSIGRMDMQELHKWGIRCLRPNGKGLGIR